MEPPICKPLAEGVPKLGHYTDQKDATGRAAETAGILAEPRAGTVGSIVAWLQHMEHPPNPELAVGTLSRVHIWTNASAAASEFRSWLQGPGSPHRDEVVLSNNRGGLTLEKSNEAASIEPWDQASRESIFNHLGFALRQAGQYLQSVSAFSCAKSPLSYQEGAA